MFFENKTATFGKERYNSYININKYTTIFFLLLTGLLSFNIKSFGEISTIIKDDKEYYQINTKEDLIEFGQIVNGEGEYTGNKQNTSANAILAEDITLNSDEEMAPWHEYAKAYADWVKDNCIGDAPTAPVTNPSLNFTPIGKHWKNEYRGEFNGNGYSIIGLFCNDITSSSNELMVGLFGNVGEGGKIKNLGIKNSYVSRSGDGTVGMMIAANTDGIVEDCYVIESEAIGNGASCIGVLIGFSNREESVKNCYVEKSTAVIYNKKKEAIKVGALIGVNYGSVDNCRVTETEAIGKGYFVCVGALIGNNCKGSVKDFYIKESTAIGYGENFTNTNVGIAIGFCEGGSVTGHFCKSNIISNGNGNSRIAFGEYYHY